MPSWIWIPITLFSLSMIALGLFVIIKGALRIFTNVSNLSSSVIKCFDKLQSSENSVKKNTDPFFTRPISDAAQSVEDARVQVLKRRQQVGDLHRTVWQHWNDMSLRKEDIDNPNFTESKE
ncbi:hypothetical protein [Gardnerella vaginalis]|uniref:Uncharacterized protein n=1 Tax=Gardnerella vaginalis TaxID=2702 RepID=A0A133NQB9_GARVA|nr:hypothetical protein [Gardnerella vaginalis]KXA18493.1 hypothetical protein HMPREF3216_00423 [Gardnerella vaginalis]MDK7192014.1 hypothetical protein [Bifidobacterium sp. UMB1197]